MTLLNQCTYRNGIPLVQGQGKYPPYLYVFQVTLYWPLSMTLLNQCTDRKGIPLVQGQGKYPPYLYVFQVTLYWPLVNDTA